ncbi:MAG: single-stranded DNA-binding protein [Aquisalimonadaceae bacterium]
MANSFRGRGNLGAAPVLRHTESNGESLSVVNLRVYFDRPKPDGDGGFEDKGGFWMNVAYWGRNAENIARLLRKGSRIFVDGELLESSWTDRESGEIHTQVEIRALHVDLDPGKIASIEWLISETRDDEAES